MISAGIIVITIIAYFFLKKRKMLPERKVVLLIFFLEGISLLLTVKSYLYKTDLSLGISRPEALSGDTKEDITASYDGEKTTLSFNISERELKKEEADKYLELAKEEIDETIKGKNESLDLVSNDLYIKKTYADGFVDAAFSFYPEDKDIYISSDGKIDFLSVDAPSLVLCEAALSCGEYETIYQFPIQIVKKDENTADGFLYYLNKSLIEADEKDKTGESVYLPKSVMGKDVSWSVKRDNTGDILAVFSLFSGALILLLKRGEEKGKEKKIQSLLDSDYPDIVSALSLYVGASLPPKTAFLKMAENYQRKIKEGERGHPGYMAVIRLSREMKDGKSESEAYESLSENTRNKNYRKLSLLLSQNLKKGTANLIALLENEEREAFEMRKNIAKVKGEEASTKLLLPMVGMLLIVLLIMILPALWGINM